MASHRAVAWLLLGAAFLLWLAAQQSSDARAELRPAPRRRPPLRPSAYRESDYDRLARLERHLERACFPPGQPARPPSGPWSYRSVKRLLGAALDSTPPRTTGNLV